MKSYKLKLTTIVITIIVTIQLIVNIDIVGFGTANIGWDIIHKGLFGENVTLDFSARENGVLFMLVFLILIAFIYILFRIYKVVFKKS